MFIEISEGGNACPLYEEVLVQCRKQDRITVRCWIALDVYLTGQVQDHLSVRVRVQCLRMHIKWQKTVGSMRTPRALTIAELEVRCLFVNLGGRSETPHTDAGLEPLRVARLILGGARVDCGLRHVAAHCGRSLTKRLLVRRIEVELPRERALAAESTLSWQVSFALLGQLRHLGQFAFPLSNRLQGH